jgi:hypothetical protein
MSAPATCAGCGALVPADNLVLHEVRCRANPRAAARAAGTGALAVAIAESAAAVAISSASARAEVAVATLGESATWQGAAAGAAPRSPSVWQEHLQAISDSDRVLAAGIERDEQEELDELVARQLAEDARAALPTLVAPPWQEGCADCGNVLSQLLLSSARSNASIASSSADSPRRAAPAAAPDARAAPPHEPRETADAQHRRYVELASTIAEGHRLLAASPRALSGLARAGASVVRGRAGDLDLELAIQLSLRR